MRKGSRLQHCIAIAAIVAAAGLGLAPRPGAAQKTFSGATEVVVVEVPVQVVKDGEPVRGLTANDFELYDGRKKVPITGFEVLDLASAPQGNAQAAAIPVSARRHFLMLFDLSFSEPKSIVKARQAALDVVKSLHPTDLVAVATYSTMQGPQLVLGFTPDRQQIAAALETLGLPKLFNRSADPLRLVLTDMTSAMGHTTGTGATTRSDEIKESTEGAVIDTLESFAGASEHAARTIDQQTLRTMTTAFSNLAQLMGEVEGRKYVIYLSEGFDSSLITGRNNNTAEAMRNQAGQITGDESRIIASTEGTGADDQFGDTRSQNALSKMLDDFRRADCAIHTVNIAGVKAGADQGFQRADGKETLLTLAKDTGGEFYENYNNLAVAMGQMLRRTGVTYVLSFQPDDLKPGDYHKLRVELKNGSRGVRVVHRPGYYAPKPYQQESPLQKVLETANDVLSEEHGTIATSVLAAPFAGANGRANVPVVVEVDGPTLLAGKQETQLPVEVYIYALDQNGGVQDFVTQTVGLDLAKAEPTLRQGGLKYFANLELPPGKYAIRTLIRNGSTGASSLRVTELEVPAQGAPTLLPAIFQDAAPTRWVNLPPAKREGHPAPPYLFLLPKDQPYVPTSRPALTPGQEVRVIVQGYNLGAGDWKAEAKVLSADGKEVSGGSLQLVDKEAGAGPRPTRLVAAFRPPNLPPGDYQLRVVLTDGAGQTQTSTARFAVGAAAGARGSG